MIQSKLISDNKILIAMLIINYFIKAINNNITVKIYTWKQ